MEQRSRLFRAASKRVSQICQAAVTPDFNYKPLVPVLQALGLGRAAGIRYRPKLLQANIVRRVFFAAAMHPNAKKPDHKRSFVPALDALPAPLWPGPGRRRLRGKQTPILDISLPSVKRNTCSH